MSSELGLDPSDPLNMLLHNTPQSGDSSMEDVSSSSQAESPPYWSQLSAMWSCQQPMDPDSLKYPDLGVDFNLSDMDFNPSMSIDPTALQYNHQVLSLPQSSYPSNSEPLSVSFPFTFSSPDPSVSSNDFGEIKPRRLSMTSISSSSGASLSPTLEPTSGPELAKSAESPADELAQRVRQSAGVMLAVPAGAHAQQPLPDKLPIPRLPRPKLLTRPKKENPKGSSTSSSVASSTAGSPPPSDIAPVPSGRPKTSHTTIERRYRTNLNARIQSLRQAVPALRVLEGAAMEDVVDERGFVDGVKVARKGSKANVLGKAVEYIRVLKKREARLKREQSGLKSLLSGLVGGPALLKEWEREWIAKFGGEEKDEVEDDEAESDDDEGDGDGDGEGDERDDDEGARTRKKAKVVKAPKEKKVTSPATGAAGAVPEKRKRGRPRKNATPPAVPIPTPAEGNLATAAATDGVQQPLNPPHGGQPLQQYLLATFALFSFFNSPFTSSSSSHPHSHTGSVLTPAHPQAPVPISSQQAYGWRDLIQAFHLLVTILVFFSIIVPWLPAVLKRSRLASYILSPISTIVPRAPPSPSAATQSRRDTRKELSTSDPFSRVALIDALSPSCKGRPDEVFALRDALGVSSGILGLAQGFFRGAKRHSETFEQRQLEQRAWVRLGELVAIDCSVSTATRLQAYWCMRSRISWFKASPSDLSTLALIIFPLSSTKAEVLWARALKADFIRPFERLVLEIMSVESAVACLASHKPGHTGYAPLGVLAARLVQEGVRKHASLIFVRTVLPNYTPSDCEGVDVDNTGLYAHDADEDARRKQTIDAGKSLGGRMRELSELLEKVWDTGFCALEDISPGTNKDLTADANDAKIRSLLSALVLYRRIFPSAIMSCTNGHASAPSVSFILSPPPSPSRKDAALHLALRKALASSAFEVADDTAAEDEGLGDALEDARDRVVDMIVDSERAMKGRGGRMRL